MGTYATHTHTHTTILLIVVHSTSFVSASGVFDPSTLVPVKYSQFYIG